MYNYILLAHLLSATIWTGGHLILSFTILPRVLKEKNIAEIKRFESGFEKIGIPALLIQVSSGLWLAHNLLPDFGLWLQFDNPVSRLIMFKLSLLFATALLAIDARLRIIPKLTEDNLIYLAYHIIPVTIISVLFVVVGFSFKTGLLY
ncbi:copper resistance protein CopD [Moritella viscosa]|uniref:copper resistance protein CopD n=1 Tax=Moritella viscosa TaxID=80854 RepID=UPI00094BFC69|nr:copper resistance protein CopD [Moritella viscosa]